MNECWLSVRSTSRSPHDTEGKRHRSKRQRRGRRRPKHQRHRESSASTGTSSVQHSHSSHSLSDASSRRSKRSLSGVKRPASRRGRRHYSCRHCCCKGHASPLSSGYSDVSSSPLDHDRRTSRATKRCRKAWRHSKRSRSSSSSSSSSTSASSSSSSLLSHSACKRRASTTRLTSPVVSEQTGYVMIVSLLR